jgi:aldehyde dehydrogenase (NAD+)
VIFVGDASDARESLVEHVVALSLGDPAEAATVVGPLITQQARVRVSEAVEAARSTGARVLTGGRSPDTEGWFYEPALVDGVGADDELAREEVFGPVCALFQASDLDEAVRIANATRYGLVAAVFTSDLDVALDVASRLEAGLIRVNVPTTGVDFHAPFGGDKDSSAGPREQGRAAREFFTTTATITIAPATAPTAPWSTAGPGKPERGPA